MVKIRINNKDIEVAEGASILDAARIAGFSIPTLCHKDGVPHYSSCMVCMVKDNKKNAFIPSCSAPAQDGMDIDVSGDDVIHLRRKAIELLLSEHRAECEAPCRVVCPAGYNIPLMNRYLSSKDFGPVVDLIASEMGAGELNCITCKAFCENACRRKKIDEPVSIRNMRIFIADELKRSGRLSGELTAPVLNKMKSFSSRTGKIEAEELQEWLKECIGDLVRHREISSMEVAGYEAASCMHCDCRAAGNCDLRRVTEELGVKDPGGKVVNAPVMKKINQVSGLIFENAKCIKCGLCVRTCTDTDGEPGLCFIERGFISIISEPLTAGFNDVLLKEAAKAVEVCPTGALSFKKGSVS